MRDLLFGGLLCANIKPKRSVGVAFYLALDAPRNALCLHTTAPRASCPAQTDRDSKFQPSGVAVCKEMFRSTYKQCYGSVPRYAAAICWPLKIRLLCNFIRFVGGNGLCDSRKQVSAIPKYTYFS